MNKERIIFESRLLGYDSESMKEIREIFASQDVPDAEPENDGPTAGEFVDIMKDASRAGTASIFPPITLTARKAYRTKK